MELREKKPVKPIDIVNWLWNDVGADRVIKSITSDELSALGDVLYALQKSKAGRKKGSKSKTKKKKSEAEEHTVEEITGGVYDTGGE